MSLLEKALKIDKKEILEKVPKLSYVDVRRTRWPLCEALIQEAYEGGYASTAVFIERLVQKENDSKQQKLGRVSICDAKEIALEMFEKLKEAEECAHNEKDIEKTLEIALQCALKILKKSPEYAWFVEEFLYQIPNIITQIPDPKQMGKAKVWYFIGKFMNEAKNDQITSFNYFEVALSLCKGTNWKTLTTFPFSLETYVCQDYCKSLLSHAKRIERKNIKEAEESATKAATLALQESVEKSLHIEAGLDRATYIIKQRRFSDAAKVLAKLLSYATYLGDNNYTSQLLLKQGICYYNLGKLDYAIKKLECALQAIEGVAISKIQAEIQLTIGKIKLMQHGQFRVALNHFIESEKMYETLNDYDNAKKVTYFIALVQANEVFPNLVGLCRVGGVEARNRMWDWKDRCVPFWTEATLEEVGNPNQLFFAQRIKLQPLDESQKAMKPVPIQKLYRPI